MRSDTGRSTVDTEGEPLKVSYVRCVLRDAVRRVAKASCQEHLAVCDGSAVVSEELPFPQERRRGKGVGGPWRVVGALQGSWRYLVLSLNSECATSRD